MQADKLRVHAIARASGSRLDGVQCLVSASFAVRSVSLGVLDAACRRLDASAALLLQARALLERIDAPVKARRLRSVPTPTEPLDEGREDVLPPPRCLMRGCARPAPFRPCFVVSQGLHRTFISDMPVRVCSEHRVDLDTLFQRRLDELGRKLRLRGHEPPDGVRVVFEVVD